MDNNELRTKLQSMSLDEIEAWEEELQREIMKSKEVLRQKIRELEEKKDILQSLADKYE